MWFTLLILQTAANYLTIGILTVPSEIDQYPQEQYSTLDASYVKYIEGAGAIVIPIQWDATYSELDYYFNQINGLLLTGGDTKIYLNETQAGFAYNKFTDTVSYLLHKALVTQEVFPIYGICQGFQIMSYIGSNYFTVLEPVIDNLQKHRLFELIKDDAYMFSSMNRNTLDYIQNEIGPFEYNHWAVFQRTYDTTTMNKLYEIVGYSDDAIGQKYIAAIQGKKFPLFANQFHPEKHQYEFNGESLHTRELIHFGQHLVNQFIIQARLNKHLFPSALEVFSILEQNSIYSYQVLYIDAEDQTQSYIFERKQINQNSEVLGIQYMRQYLLQL